MTEVIFKGREIEVFRKGKMIEEKSIGSEREGRNNQQDVAIT